MLKKFANSVFTITEEVSPEKALSSEAITNRFKTITAEIKKISPRSQDFLYFVARGIHAMEAASIDPVTKQFDAKLGHVANDNGKGLCAICGIPLYKTARGQIISGLWCQSSQVDPFVNQNGDAFPEAELLSEFPDPEDKARTIKAYQTFVGKGLFTDHKSSEVENIRGIILDAEYDVASKGVDLLIALDKVAYPELARQVTAGYSASVSMGVGVGHSLCSICGNKAITENDYCDCVRTSKGLQRAGSKMCYEVNNGLSFIEISIVGTGADPRAKIKTILASLDKLKKAQKMENFDTKEENQLILDNINRIESEVHEVASQLSQTIESPPNDMINPLVERIAKIEEKLSLIDKQIKIGGNQMTEKKAYMQGTVEPEGKPFNMSDKNYKDYWEEDKHLHGQGMESGKDGLHPGYGMGSDEDIKKRYFRADAKTRRQLRSELLERLAYMQGTVEPEEGPFTLDGDKNYKDHWEEDKHMVGKGMESGKDGLHPGYGKGSDEQVKKELLRAHIRARLVKSANPTRCRWTVFAGTDEVLSFTAEEAFGDTLRNPTEDQDIPMTNFEWFTSTDYGQNLISAIKEEGLPKIEAAIKAASQIKTAQEQLPPPAEAQEVNPEPLPEMPAMEQEEVSETDPEHVENQLSATEAIRGASDQIEEAVQQIRSMSDSISDEYGPEAAAEGEALAGELSEMTGELGELGGEFEEVTPEEEPRLAALKKLTKQAFLNTSTVLERAAEYVEKYSKKDDKKDSKKKDDKKKDDKKKDDKKDDKKKFPFFMKKDKKDKKASLEARQAARQALAQQLYGLTSGDMIDEAHPEGGNTSTFPGQPDGKIETVKEQQEIDVEVAESQPRGELTARKAIRQKMLYAAEKLMTAQVVDSVPETKKLDEAKKQVDEAKKNLVDQAKEIAKTAEVDKETKQFYSELSSESALGNKADKETKSFYNELTQDFTSQKRKADLETKMNQFKRAFALSYKRAQLGQIEDAPEAIQADAERLSKLDEQSFAAFADVVENTKPTPKTAQVKQTKTASLRPGLGEDNGMPKSNNLVDSLSKIKWS